MLRSFMSCLEDCGRLGPMKRRRGPLSLSTTLCKKRLYFSFITSAKEVMFLRILPDFVCVCVQDNSKSYRRIFLKFWGYVGHGITYNKFWGWSGRNPGFWIILKFRYHCVKGGINEPLAKRRWWRRLANSFALAEVPALSECFLQFVQLPFCINHKNKQRRQNKI